MVGSNDRFLRGAPVVILDDDPQISAVLRIRLERDGFEVVTVGNLTELGDVVRQVVPVAVVIDLNLGNEDGLHGATLLAARGYRGPIFLMSGADENAIAEAHREAKALGLNLPQTFRKPFSLSALSAAITISNNTSKGTNVAAVCDAIESGAIRPYFQAQLDLKTGRIVGAEALARWVRADGTLAMPSTFIPMIEQAGLWRYMTSKILADTAAAIRQWQDAGITPCKVSVNLEGAVAADPEFGLDAEKIVDAQGIDHGLIGFEITEQMAMSDISTALRALTWMRKKGFDLSLDDFGTGFSSLSVLHSMPFSEIKIDRSFVQRMTADRDSRVIVKATIDLTHNLDLLCVAEGIDSVATCHALMEMGCDLGQGYLFGPAVDAQAFGAILDKGWLPLPGDAVPAPAVRR